MSPEKRLPPVILMNLLESYANKFLSKGREWDVPHTKAVVHYAGRIAESEGLDVLVLVTTAWLHDTGYYALFEGDQSRQYEAVMDRKTAHMLNGARLAREFLEQPHIKDFYIEEQIERIVHLVSIHDKVEELSTKEEIAFMEADTLGAIDVSRVTPTFDRVNAAKYTNNDLLGRRFPKFKTSTGIGLFQELLPKFIAYFDKE